MASIQQSFNQILQQAAIGAGLYAHSPAGQKMAHKQSLKRNLQAAYEKYDIESAEAEYHPDPKVSEKIDKKFHNQIANIKGELYQIDPTAKAYQSYLDSVQAARQFKTGFKDRISYLTGEEYAKIKREKEKAGVITPRHRGGDNNGN